MLKVDLLGKRYGSKWVFRSIGFELGLGDRLLVSGRNGSGKSTLLKTIVGLTEKSEGSIVLPDGDPRITIGFCAIDQTVYSHLTVVEHLELTANLRGCDPRTAELLAMVDLAYARDLLARQLSTGMRARLKLAMAVQANPAVLLLDEPSAGLDEEGRGLVARIVEEQSGRGCLVIASNDAAERRYANFEIGLG